MMNGETSRRRAIGPDGAEGARVTPDRAGGSVRAGVMLLAAVVLIAGLWTPANGQPTQRTHRVGVLFQAQLDAPRLEAIRRGILQVITEADATVVLEPRSAAAEPGRLPELAAELVRARVDVILAIAPASVRAARNATSAIPIVVTDLETDPIASGLLGSLGRPGGNVTGIFLDAPEISGKWLQLLQEAVPGLRRVAVLWDPTTGPAQAAAAESAANELQLALHRIEANRPADFGAALGAAAGAGAEALLVLSSPLFGTEAPRIAELALQHRLPAIMLFPAFARSGGLLSYGPDNLDLLRQAGALVGKVLNGAAPATLPAERPIRFRLLANQNTARILGLALPQSILVSADEIIQ